MRKLLNYNGLFCFNCGDEPFVTLDDPERCVCGNLLELRPRKDDYKVPLLCKDCGVTGRCACPRPWASVVDNVILDIRDAIKQEGGEPYWFIPDESYIETLDAGDLTLDNFGQVNKVTGIVYRDKTRVKFFTSYGRNGSKVGGTLKAERLTRTIPLRGLFNHVELDNLEYELLRRLALEAEGWN